MRLRRPVLCAAAVLWIGIACAATFVRAEEIAKFALVIGKNEPEAAGRAALHYADDDAIAMHRLFEEAGIESTLLVKPDTDTARLQSLKYGAAPTREAVLSALTLIFKKVESARASGRKTELFFYYSGHGDVDDGEGFVVLANGRLTRTFLREEIIARSPADTNHVIIDACKSYFMVFGKGPGGERRPFTQSFGDAGLEEKLSRTGFILSASSHQDSHEWERYQAGIFSYEVRSALRGGADANQDAAITYGELGAFVTTANSGIVNPRFRPQFLVRPPGRGTDYSKAIFNWSKNSGLLRADAPSWGHFYLETASGIRVADVNPSESQQLTLYLPVERPLFARRADDTEERVLLSTESVRLSALTVAPASVSGKGALNLAFESLFSAPFDGCAVTVYSAQQEQAAALADVAQSDDGNTRLRPLRTALLSTATASLVVGGTLSIVALTRLNAAEDAPQRDRPEMNQTIDHLNTAAMVFYGVAAAAGVSWLTLKLRASRGRRTSFLLTPVIGRDTLMVGATGTWGKGEWR